MPNIIDRTKELYQSNRGVLVNPYYLEEYGPGFCDEIARDYHQNRELANNYPEITSQHLINFVNELLKKEKI